MEVDHYPEVSSDTSIPEGLNRTVISPHLCANALEAITAGHESTRGHTVKEMGNTFYSDHKASEWDTPSYKLPKVWLPKAVKEFIATAQAQLGYSPPQWDRINVIYREYSKGGKLKPHVDRINVFDEKIINCVLENSSDSQLTLYPPQGPLDADLIMQEVPGHDWA